ncbi:MULTISPECIES: hypothetical protein [Pseudoalteromonas]|uniref:hypothetical protein n=1 Tax=Pseudoalteromonas TaxID=53246 RepID=UPI001583A985|nr:MULTISPECIES: hypothetical protein [Pseudoalteromonas]MDI4652627.1 hypothetical protein [Pseudoalteromonas shioyasakiensis]NUJ38663.1 hypothetical protein [Pseudoalteromonas sp. 0303]
MSLGTTVKVIEVDDLSDDLSPDMPYKCVVKLIQGSIDAAMSCADLQIGPYAKLKPLFNVDKLDANTFKYSTFSCIKVGDTFTCANDPAIQNAIDTKANVKRHTTLALSRQVHVAISEPIIYEPWTRLRTFESYKHGLTDCNENLIERYSLCTLKNDTESNEVFCIESVNVDDKTVSLSALSRCPYDLYTEEDKPVNEIKLCTPRDEEQRLFDKLIKLRPVIQALGECHHIDLIHYISKLIVNDKHTLSQAVELICKRIITLIGIKKTTVYASVQYTSLSDSEIKSHISKIITISECINALTSLGLPNNTEWSEMENHYMLVIGLEPQLERLYRNLLHI